MERLISPIDDGGAPYLNQDFFQFLQENHIDCYSTFLDQINDTNTGNCGIILNLPENHYYEVKTFSVPEREGLPPTIGYKVDRTFTYNLVNSLIYLDGEFLEPAPWIATQSEFSVNIFGLETQYLVKVEIDKIRRYTKVYDFLETVIERKYFDIVFTQPSGNYIALKPTPNSLYPVFTEATSLIPSGAPSGFSTPPPPPILPFLISNFPDIIGFNLANYSEQLLLNSRHFNRILKYYLADDDDIFMTYDIRFFDTFGIGFGDKFGFRLIKDDVTNSTSNELVNYEIYKDEKGNYLPNGRFFIGYATFSNISPSHLTLDKKLTKLEKSTFENYGRPMNVGGEEYHQIQPQCVTPHGHSFSGTPSNQMEHSHFIPTCDQFQFTKNEIDPGDFWNTLRLTKGSGIPYRADGIGDIPGDLRQGIISNWNKYYSFKLIDTMDPLTLYEVDPDGTRTESPKDISNHTHPIDETPSNNWTGSPISLMTNKHNDVHYNVPPYATVYYYKKWNPYKSYVGQFGSN